MTRLRFTIPNLRLTFQAEIEVGVNLDQTGTTKPALGANKRIKVSGLLIAS